MKRLILSAILVTVVAAPARTGEPLARRKALTVAPFSFQDPSPDPPPGWRQYHFKKTRKGTAYSLVADGGTTVLRAEAHGGGSLLFTFVDIDPVQYPIVRWRWKVLDLPERTDLHVKAGDDAAARVYVAFRHTPERITAFERFKYNLVKAFTGHYPPYAAVCFLWARELPVGTVIRNAFVERSIQVVVRSGKAGLGRWIQEEQEPARIFEEAMGFPPPPISHVAVMTDTENTGTNAAALFGDIEFLPAPPGIGAGPHGDRLPRPLDERGHGHGGRRDRSACGTHRF